MNKEDLKKYTLPNYCFNANHPLIKAYTEKAIKNATTDLEKAVALYYAIRDGFRYNPHNVKLHPDYMRASAVVQRPEGHCVDKATLMVACCRSENIPARIGFAKVSNHIGTSKLEELLKTNVLVPHGYVEIYLEGQWVKATPAFNKELCDKLGVKPLEFEGKKDSLFQEYDKEGGQFMEYLYDFGTFEELPLLLMYQLMQKEYPHLYPESEEVVKTRLETFFDLVSS